MKNFSNSVKKILSIALAFIFICGVFGASASAGTYSTGTYVVAVANGVNVRSGAGTNYNIVGSLSKGNTVTILETVTIGTSKWGRINQGWICLDYVRMN